MPRITRPRFSRLAALLAVAVLGLALAASASADTPPGRGPNGGPAPTPSPTPPAGDCAVLRVQLNGDQPATHTCLTQAPVGQGTDSPAAAIVQGDCLWGDVRLYEHRNFGGARICFTGSGTVNLRNYVLWRWPFPGTWSDNVSSVSTQDWGVYLYEHANAGGARIQLRWRAAFTDLGSFWNDRASSLCLPSSTYRCP